MRHGYIKGTVIILVLSWGFLIFLAAADRELLSTLVLLPLIMFQMTVVMTLRVYAMWNRSNRIFYVLLFIYIPQVVVSVAIPAIYYNPNTHLSGMFRDKLPASL